MSMIIDDTLSPKQKVELIRERIKWIDVHEQMFELTSIMKLERQLLKEELEELEQSIDWGADDGDTTVFTVRNEVTDK